MVTIVLQRFIVGLFHVFNFVMHAFTMLDQEILACGGEITLLTFKHLLRQLVSFEVLASHVFLQVSLQLCDEATFLTLVTLWDLVSVALAMKPRGVNMESEGTLALGCEGTVSALELFILGIIMHSLRMIFQLILGECCELAIGTFFSHFAMLRFHVLIQEIPDCRRKWL